MAKKRMAKFATKIVITATMARTMLYPTCCTFGGSVKLGDRTYNLLKIYRVEWLIPWQTTGNQGVPMCRHCYHGEKRPHGDEKFAPKVSVDCVWTWVHHVPSGVCRVPKHVDRVQQGK